MTTLSPAQQHRESELVYALAKQLPDIAARGCVIQSSYGDLDITGDDADILSCLLEVLVKRELDALRAVERGVRL